MPTPSQDPWKILYVGPASFQAESWRTRAEYILPDLFGALGPGTELHLLTGAVPDFARAPLAALVDRCRVHHHEIAPAQEGQGRVSQWIAGACAVARAVQPQVVTNVFGSQWLGDVVTQAAAACGAQSVVRVAGDEIGSRAAMGVYDKDPGRRTGDLDVERAGLLRADAVIAMSPWEAARLRAVIGPAADKVRVCIRGVDLSLFRPAAASGEHRAPRRFLYVGRRSAEKGYDLIEAAARDVGAKDPGIEFVFVGDFPPRREDNRTYLGWVETADLPDLYRSVDAFVLPSRSEGFPQVVAEAMASGLPCILSSHLFAGMFTDGEDALLCDLSAPAIAAQILRLGGDAGLAQHLGRRGRELAQAHFDPAFWQRRYAAILRMQPPEPDALFDAAAAPTGAAPRAQQGAQSALAGEAARAWAEQLAQDALRTPSDVSGLALERVLHAKRMKRARQGLARKE